MLLIPFGHLLNYFHQILKSYLGYNNNSSKNHHLSFLSWHKIYFPKSLGGLAIWLMENHNKALLATLGWKIISKENFLWVSTTRTNYFHNYDLLQSSCNPSASWIWKGIMKNLEVVSKDACRSFSLSSFLNVWSHPWVPSLPLFKPLPNPSTPFLLNLMIIDLIEPLSKTWRSIFLFQVFYATSANSILKIHIPRDPPSQ